MKKIIRLTESDLHRIVKESAKRILREINDNPQAINNSLVGNELPDNVDSRLAKQIVDDLDINGIKITSMPNEKIYDFLRRRYGSKLSDSTIQTIFSLAVKKDGNYSI